MNTPTIVRMGKTFARLIRNYGLVTNFCPTRKIGITQTRIAYHFVENSKYFNAQGGAVTEVKAGCSHGKLLGTTSAHGDLTRTTTTSQGEPMNLMVILFGLSLFGVKKDDEEEEKNELIMMMKRGILAMRNGELNKAEQILHVALKTAQELQNKEAITYIFDLLANIAFQQQNFPQAEKLFKEVIRRLLADGMRDDDNAIVEISLKLASVYASMKSYSKAAEGFRFCIATQEKKMHEIGEDKLDDDTLLLCAMSRDWCARFLINLGEFALAKEHFLKAYEISSKVNGPLHEQTAVLLNDIGSVCALQKKLDEAIAYFEKAIAIAKECNSSDLGSFYVNLGSVYIQRGALNKAENFCQEGLKVAKKINNSEAEAEAQECIATLKKLGTDKNLTIFYNTS